jgi:hypothetical protein
MTGRQNFWTSRLQAFCSSGVPLRAGSAMALEETGIDNRISAKRKLRIVFLHSEAREKSIPISGGHVETDFVEIANAAKPTATRAPEALLNAAKFAAVRSGTRELDA